MTTTGLPVFSASDSMNVEPSNRPSEKSGAVLNGTLTTLVPAISFCCRPNQSRNSRPTTTAPDAGRHGRGQPGPPSGPARSCLLLDRHGAQSSDALEWVATNVTQLEARNLQDRQIGALVATTSTPSRTLQRGFSDVSAPAHFDGARAEQSAPARAAGADRAADRPQGPVLPGAHGGDGAAAAAGLQDVTIGPPWRCLPPAAAVWKPR